MLSRRVTAPMTHVRARPPHTWSWKGAEDGNMISFQLECRVTMVMVAHVVVHSPFQKVNPSRRHRHSEMHLHLKHWASCVWVCKRDLEFHGPCWMNDKVAGKRMDCEWVVGFNSQSTLMDEWQHSFNRSSVGGVLYRARKYGFYVIWWNLFLRAKQQQEQISRNHV